jgi:hypothetical protein
MSGGYDTEGQRHKMQLHEIRRRHLHRLTGIHKGSATG